MKGVILVGGEGTRLRPLTSRLPKPMVPIANRPFLERMIAWIRDNGISDIVLALGYLPDRIRDQLGDGSVLGVRLSYVVEDVPLGTAGAVKNAAGHLDDTCFVFNGDILTDLDLRAMLAAHRKAKAKVSISLTPVDDPSQFGVVEFDEDHLIRSFIEKPKREEALSNLINAGTYIIEPEVLERVPDATYWMFERQLFPELLAAGERMLAFPSDAYWIDIGTPEKYLTVQFDLLEGRLLNEEFSAENAGKLMWGDVSGISPDAVVEGPVVLGTGATVAAGASIIGPTVLGAGCRVGQGVVVSRSVLWHDVIVDGQSRLKGAIVADGARIHGADIGDAVIGQSATIETGNRLDHGIRIWPDRLIPAQTISFG